MREYLEISSFYLALCNALAWEKCIIYSLNVSQTAWRTFAIKPSFTAMLWWSCLPLDPKFAGSNPIEDDVFLRAVTIRSTTSFGWVAKPSAPCRKILRNVKVLLRYDRDTDRQNSATISHPFLPFTHSPISHPATISPRFATRCIYFNQSREFWWMNREWLELRWGAQ
jgi:hypothetical protein